MACPISMFVAASVGTLMLSLCETPFLRLQCLSILKALCLLANLLHSEFLCTFGLPCSDPSTTNIASLKPSNVFAQQGLPQLAVPQAHAKFGQTKKNGASAKKHEAPPSAVASPAPAVRTLHGGIITFIDLFLRKLPVISGLRRTMFDISWNPQTGFPFMETKAAED